MAAAGYRGAMGGAGGGAEFVRLEEDGGDAVVGKLERGREPRIAAPDDRHARRSWHLVELPGRWPISLPPIGGRGKIAVEDVGNHLAFSSEGELARSRVSAVAAPLCESAPTPAPYDRVPPSPIRAAAEPSSRNRH